jgi:trehalose 6-phosphate synthase
MWRHGRQHQSYGDTIAKLGGRMGGRLIIVSNRVAVPDSPRTPLAGGMGVAVKAALKNRDGFWFGWSGKVTEEPTAQPTTVEVNNLTYVLIDLSNTDLQEYYNGLANSVLWPILHYRVDLQKYSRADASGYLRVNRMFAERLSDLINEDDVIWVHDYHLMLLARELRSRGYRNKIGFFLHTPCAPPDILYTLPRHREILGGLTYYDLVGFQTENDRDNFAHYLVQQGAAQSRNGYEIDGQRVRLGAFPVSVETKAYMRLARNAGRSALVAHVRESLGGSRLVLGVDRLDCSKGIPARIKGFERFLELNPDWRGKVTLLQLTPNRRFDFRQYGDIESEVNGLIGKVNGRFGDAAWTPIRYVNRSYSRTVLAGMYRAADVAMVTPLRDGMNLVAKEYLAAQDPEDPGVLLLSQFAGAAKELDRALIINPHETDAVAAALERALEMPLDERRERHAPMLAHLLKHDIKRWARSYTSTLVDGRMGRGLLEVIRSLLKPSTAETPHAALGSVEPSGGDHTALSQRHYSASR